MSSTPILNAQGQPIRSALKSEDDVARTPPSGPVKAVQIAEPEPLPQEEFPALKRQFSAGMSGKRLSGRPAINPTASSSRSSFLSQNSLDVAELSLAGSQVANPMAVPAEEPSAAAAAAQQNGQQPKASHRVDRVSEKLLSQVAEWIQREKAKRESRKPRKHHHHHHHHHIRRKHANKTQQQEEEVEQEETLHEEKPELDPELALSLHRTTSVDSNSSDVSLDRLQRILDDSMAALGLNGVPQYGPKIGRRSSHRSKKYSSRSALQLSRAASSDTDYVDGDVLVPSCDAVLDNTKTLKYSQGSTDDTVSMNGRREEKEKQAWTTFKNEIIRLAHTLRLKGWRRVPLDSGEDVCIERLSGALTNAVYVVTPPAALPESTEHLTKKTPEKLLLRIYGPNVEHLIDRDNELQILKRLARKKIGPRLLGTFKNGRFEQFFNAYPLTFESLREPVTSRQIAKRMRELHQGVELLEHEKDEGPTVFKNWDCWVVNVERRMRFLDLQVAAMENSLSNGTQTPEKTARYVCGVEWPKFKAMVDKYREFLVQSYGGSKAIREKLVFAHNDTQYGNILRVRPADESSPLLQPENTHKQLIVIDFEYASANLPGFEFANHFSEWAYNYHDAVAPYACTVERNYPTPDQQHHFVKAYVNHRPRPFLPTSSSSSNHASASEDDVTPSATPVLGATQQHHASSSSIVEFMLDARVPPGGWKEEERRANEQTEETVRELLRETRLWRPICSAQWVAWGIVQAKIPGYMEEVEEQDADANGNAEAKQQELEQRPDSPAGSGNGSAEEHQEGFDYLSYAHDRALFFWGDCVAMGLIGLDELPEGLRERVKTVDY